MRILVCKQQKHTLVILSRKRPYLKKIAEFTDLPEKLQEQVATGTKAQRYSQHPVPETLLMLTINITDAHHQYYFCLPPAAAAILSAHFHWDAELSSLQNLTPHCPIALLNSLQLLHT